MCTTPYAGGCTMLCHTFGCNIRLSFFRYVENTIESTFRLPRRNRVPLSYSDRPNAVLSLPLFRLLMAMSEFSARKFQRCTSAGNCACFLCDIQRHGWCHVALICDRVALSVPMSGSHQGVRNAAAPLCTSMASIL